MGDSATTDALPPALAFLAGGGEAARMILARDWTGHPLGPPEDWPAALKVSLGLVLNSPESMILCWDPDELSFFFNDTYFPLLGPRLSWAMGAPFREVWADGLEQATPIIEDAFAGNSRRFVDLPWRLDTDRGASDTWWSFSYSRVFDEGGQVAGLFIFTNETTARVLADRALADSQAKLEGLNRELEARVEVRTAERDKMWTTSPDLMVVLSPDGFYQRVNPAWTAVLGHAARDLVGRHALDLVHPDDLAATEAALATAKAGTLPTFENRFRHRDGGWRWLSWVAAPGEDTIFAVGRHVTDAREAQAALARAEDQLRQAQKMEAVGQLTGGLAHDFNNLLAGISGNLELIGRRMAQGRVGDVERHVAAARAASDRAAALTHRLLAFSRRQTLAPRPTDVNRLAAELEELVRRTAGPQVQVALALAPDAWPVLVDPPQLENALLNLCINARDAMPDGGCVTVATANVRLGSEVGGRAGEYGAPPGAYVAVSVTDTGHGMDADVAAKAFDPFFTTKPLGQGTGLGLSMIYGFARQSGGQVRIASEPGRGTVVTLHLPRYLGEADVTSSAPAGPAAEPRARAGETVLVVDDEPLVRALVVDVLDELGYAALEAADGAGGLVLLRSDARVDLLVTDVGLPGGMNGRQLADAARAIRPDLKVLYITGYAEGVLTGEGALDDGMAVLTKPFSVDGLARRIREMIAG